MALRGNGQKGFINDMNEENCVKRRSCSVRENGIHKGVGCRHRSLILRIIRNSVLDVLKQSRDECTNRLEGTKAW